MNQASTFSAMPLSEGMKKTVEEIGYNTPTPIQLAAIPELLAGSDLLGQAQTGTGKTAAFGIPLCELVDEANKDTQALVVCPTRELCLQVCEEINRLCAHKSGVNVAAIYGGQAIEQQFKILKSKKPQILVATPGRLFDHLRRKSVDLSTVFMVVLDEADKMLDMGFREEIESIFELLPEENQRIFFSATLPKGISELACTYLRNPKVVKTAAKSVSATKVSQSYYRASPREKTELLCRVLDQRDPKLAVVFCNAKSTVDELVDEIKFRGFSAGGLHGDLSQAQRDRVMASFRSGHVRVLVATDIAARGIDVDDVELVTNYHLPHDPEDYVHRIGRTGRAGRSGHAISLVDPRDNARLKRIAAFAKATIEEAEPPTISEVRAAKLAGIFGKIRTALDTNMIAEYKTFLARQELSMEDVAAGMLKLALEKFDENAKNAHIFDGLKKTRYSMGNQEDSRENRSSRGFRGRPNGPARHEERSPRGDRGGDRRFGGPRRDSASFFERQERGPERNGERRNPDRDRKPRESFGAKRGFEDRAPRSQSGGFRSEGPKRSFEDRAPRSQSGGFRSEGPKRSFEDRAPRSQNSGFRSDGRDFRPNKPKKSEGKPSKNWR